LRRYKRALTEKQTDGLRVILRQHSPRYA